jgi:hypothetical protein
MESMLTINDATVEDDRADAYTASGPVHPALKRANEALLRAEVRAGILSEDDSAEFALRLYAETREAARLTARAVRLERDDLAERAAAHAEGCAKGIKTVDPARFAGEHRPYDRSAGDCADDDRAANVPHGTYGGYCNHKCRCEDCKRANREYRRAKRASK